MKRERAPRLQSESRVEADHAVGLGRGDRQPPARVLEPAAAHPSGAVLDRVRHRQQEVAARPDGAAAVGDVIVGRMPLASLPQRLALTEQAIDRVALLLAAWL